MKWNSEGEIRYREKLIPQSYIVDLVTNTMKTRSRKGISHPIGTDRFAQALKEINVPTDYQPNPDIIKAMQRPGKISTPKPIPADKESDNNDDDTGFQKLSTFSTPQASSFLLTPKTTRKRDNILLDWNRLKTKKRKRFYKPFYKRFITILRLDMDEYNLYTGKCVQGDIQYLFLRLENG